MHPQQQTIVNDPRSTEHTCSLFNERSAVQSSRYRTWNERFQKPRTYQAISLVTIKNYIIMIIIFKDNLCMRFQGDKELFWLKLFLLKV